MPTLGARALKDITKEEVQEAVEVIKARKAPSLDGVATKCV
jgi:hypothetical protein